VTKDPPSILASLTLALWYRLTEESTHLLAIDFADDHSGYVLR
jgi:hypothetical protein